MNQKTAKFLPKNVKKDWMLYFSALLTWFFVTYLSLASATINNDFFIRLTLFIVFICLFLLNVSYFEREKEDIKIKVCIVIQILLVWYLIHFDIQDLSPILLVLIATQLAHLFNKQQALVILVIINIGYFLLINKGNDSGFFSVLIFALLQLFAYSAMEIMIRAEKDREKIAQINQELLATRFMLKTSSQRKERLRISRDLHDAIGHQLTALSLNLEVSSHKVPDEFKPMLKENLQQAKSLLANVREVVKEMRSEEQFDLVENLQNLVNELPHCQLSVINAPEISSLSLKQQLMFCLQEGISNALRHGKADQLYLDCQQDNKHLTITLSNNGNSVTTLEKGSGLSGMQERLADFNGVVKLQASSQGSELKITVEDCYD